jgi:hypothetical protein
MGFVSLCPGVDLRPPEAPSSRPAAVGYSLGRKRLPITHLRYALRCKARWTGKDVGT